MKEKALKRYQILYFLFILFSVMSSCNNEDSSENSLIVGTWAQSERYEQFIFTFHDDNTGRLDVVIDYGASVESEAFTYTFNPETMEITINEIYFGSDENPNYICKIKLIGEYAMDIITYWDYDTKEVCEIFHLFKKVV